MICAYISNKYKVMHPETGKRSYLEYERATTTLESNDFKRDEAAMWDNVWNVDFQHVHVCFYYLMDKLGNVKYKLEGNFTFVCT